MTLAMICLVASAWTAVALFIAALLGRVSAAGEHQRSMDELCRELRGREGWRDHAVSR